MRKIQFQTGEYYHIYNRGVDKRRVFLDKNDYIRFLRSMREFNIDKPIGSLYLKSQQIESNPPFQGFGLLSKIYFLFFAS